VSLQPTPSEKSFRAGSHSVTDIESLTTEYFSKGIFMALRNQARASSLLPVLRPFGQLSDAVKPAVASD
jgi:hypothetical protein